MNFDLEKTFQDEIYSNTEIQKGICDCIGINFSDTKLVREDTYINGITADFTLFQNDSVKAILECKGGASASRIMSVA